MKELLWLWCYILCCVCVCVFTGLPCFLLWEQISRDWSSLLSQYHSPIQSKPGISNITKHSLGCVLSGLLAYWSLQASTWMHASNRFAFCLWFCTSLHKATWWPSLNRIRFLWFCLYRLYMSLQRSLLGGIKACACPLGFIQFDLSVAYLLIHIQYDHCPAYIQFEYCCILYKNRHVLFDHVVVSV